jgi:amidase
MKGARIGVPSDPAYPLNDCYYGKLPPKWAKVMANAIKVLEDLGAVIVRASMPTAGWIAGPGTTMAVFNRNPLSRNKGNPMMQWIVFLYELKHDLNLYLKDWATNTAIETITDIVAFNEANAGKALRFGQDLFLAANLTRGDLSEREYKSARAMDLLAARTRGMDAYMNQHKLDAVLFAGSMGAAIAAKAGYPSVMVPAGFISGADDKDTPDYPLGVTFAGRAWSEHKLLRLAYAFEQASQMRKPPPGVPAL